MDYMAYGEAIRHFNEILSKNPEKKGIRVDLAFSLLRNGEQDKAIQVLEQELILRPDNFHAYTLLGYILYSFDKKEEALRVCQEFDKLYTKIISREISQKWPASESRISRQFFWSGRGSKESKSPLETLMAKVYARDKFYAPSQDQVENSFNKILRRLREKYHNLSLCHFIMAFLQKISGDLEESENNFKLALLNGYDRVECYSQLVDLKFLKEDWKGGIQLARETIGTLGPRSRILFLMGYASSQLLDDETARLCFEEAISLEPFCVEARKNLARTYLCRSEFDESTEFLRQVVRLAPLDMEARLLRNRSLSRNPGLTKEGRPVLSKDIVDRIRLNYKYVFHSNLKEVLSIVNERALSVIKSGYVDQAVAILRAFLELCDITPVLHYNLGLLCLDQGHLREAMKVAWRAAELEPDYLEAHDLVGNALFRIGDYERSLRAYQRVIRIDTGDAQGHYNIGLANWAMGKYDEAERSWHTAIQTDKKAKKAKLDRTSKAEELAHSLTVELSPVSFDAHKSLGALYDSLDRKEKALREFEIALEFVPNDSECYYYIGKIYYEMGDTARAIANLEKCIYLGTKWEKKAAEILKKIKKDSEVRHFVLKFGDLN